MGDIVCCQICSSVTVWAGVVHDTAFLRTRHTSEVNESSTSRKLCNCHVEYPNMKGIATVLPNGIGLFIKLDLNGNTTKYAEMIGLVSKILNDIDALYKMQ